MRLILPVLLEILIDVDVDDRLAWQELASWSVIRDQGDVLPCAVCGEDAETRTYLSPNGLESQEVCRRCEQKLGLKL
jgi:hypothetical protein